jgi:lysophospholipase L1-like esterase
VGVRLALAAVLLATCTHAQPTREPIRLLALGDSFTIGTGSSVDEAFPARIAARWNASGRAVTLRNLGVNGFTTQDLLDVELPEVRAFAPTLVTLAIGANDLVRGADPESYRSQLRRIFAALASAGVHGDRVVTIPQPEWSQSPAAADFGDAREIEARIVAFNAVLRDESQRAGARYVDLWPLMQSEAAAHMFASDGLHPSSAAHDAWASAMVRALGDGSIAVRRTN